MENKLLNIGLIQKTHQLIGALKVSSKFQDFSKLIGQKVLLKKDNKSLLVTIKEVNRMNNSKYIIYFDEVNNIEEAKLLIGYSLNINRDLLPKATSDDFYIFDLLYFDVFYNNNIIGQITDVLETNAHDILIVKDNNSKEIMIPYVEDVFILSIDFNKRKVIVNLIEGMI